MSNRTKSALKKTQKSPRNTHKKRVQIVPEKNIEVFFERPFDKVEIPELLTSKKEQKKAKRERDIESIMELGPEQYFKKNPEIEKQFLYKKSIIDGSKPFFRRRKDLPFLAANLAKLKFNKKYDENNEEDTSNFIVLKRSKSSRFLGGKSKTKRRYKK